MLFRSYIPIELNEKQSKVVCELAHRNSNAIVYWHLDENYVGTTQGIHQLGLNPTKGQHQLTIVDEYGETLMINFEILSTKQK